MGHFIADLIFALVGIFTIAVCAKRGFFLSMLKFFKLILAFTAAYFAGSAFGSWMGKLFVNEAVRNAVFNKVNAIYLKLAGDFSVENALEAVPKFLLNDSMREKLAALEGSGETLVNSITDTVAGSLSAVICAVIGYVCVFLIALVLLTVVYHLIKHLKKLLPLIGTVDSLLGALWGLLLAALLLLTAGSVFKFFFGETELYTRSILVKFFGNSSLLNFIRLLDINEWIARVQNIGR